MIVIGYQQVNEEQHRYDDFIFEEHELKVDILDAIERMKAEQADNEELVQYFLAFRISETEYKQYAVIDKQ